MNRVTVALFFTFFALSASTKICSEKILKECVSLQKCPSVWNKIEELYHPVAKNPVLGFLRYVKYNYYCDCYVNGEDPAIECPAKLPIGFKQVISKKRKCKQLPISKLQKKELDKICGYQLSNKMLTNGNRTDPTDYPWLALLQFEHSLTGERKFLCGGVLISDRHVLTAAHCVTSPSNKLVSVRLGEYDTRTEIDCTSDGDSGEICKEAGQDIEVAEYIVHEDYDDGISPRFDESEDPSDLAIVKLKTSVKFGDVRPICLPRKAEPPRQRYEVAGWSTTMAPNVKSLPEKLRSTIYGISSEECESYPITQEYSSSDHICAGGSWGQACIADAGGPLMAWEIKEDRMPRMTVFGVGFTEMPCAYASNRPGVFTQVYKYVPWIEEHIY